VNAFDYDAATGQFVLGSEASEPYTLQIPAATFTVDPLTGAVTRQPGRTVVTVSGFLGA
jgi:hypothetical protein